MSGRQHTASDSDSVSDDQNEVCRNAVDFLLSKFPPEISAKLTQEAGVVEENAALPEFDEPIQIKTEIEDVAALPKGSDPVEVKNEPEDVAALAAEQNGNEPKEADGATGEGLRFDPDLGTTYGFTELNGYRWYFLEGGAAVCLKPDDINTLKSMANTKELDSMFVSMLLSAVFGDDVLKESSAGGSKSNYNDVSHNALECNKLKFIKGLFEQRVSNDNQRMKQFTKFVNKKCNNLRRSGNKQNE